MKPQKLNKKLIDSFLGKTLAEAKAQNLWKVRAIKIDGVAKIVTMDLRGDRINVEVENGIITKVVEIG